MWAHLWPGGSWWSGFDAIWPNLAASMIVGMVMYLWSIRPHLRRQAAHREHVTQQLAELHAKHDALHQTVRQIGGQP